MTYSALVNAVLRRLRENEVSQVSSTTYSKLIGDFVNEAKREVEDAWNWNALRTTVQIVTAAGTERYALTGAGDSSKFRTLSVYNFTTKSSMNRQHTEWMTRMMLQDTNQGQPLHYDYNGQDSSGDAYVDLYQEPDGVYYINFNLVVPQDDLSSDNDALKVPSLPVILGAYAKAIAERGEDQGRTHGEVLNAYNLALSDAIAIDNSNLTGEDTWYV